MEQQQEKPGMQRWTRVLLGSVAAGALIVGTTYALHNQDKSHLTPLRADQNLVQIGEWSYMPGSEMRPEGLRIAYRDFRIVNKDGSGGQPNPPVNLYGSHLQVPDNFTLQARLVDITGPVSLQLYARPPVVSDEFRIEPNSLKFTLENNTMNVERWDATTEGEILNQQRPTYSQSYRYTPARDGAVTIGISDNDNTFDLLVNGERLGSIPDAGTFQEGEVWFGAAAGTPDAQLTIAKLTAAGEHDEPVVAVDTSRLPEVSVASDGLQTLARQHRPEFLIGSSAALWALSSDEEYRRRLLGGDFGILTPENELKWQFVEPQPGLFDFHAADAIVDEARRHGLKIHGHNLVFGEALPSWVSTMPTETPAQKAAVRQVLERHITALGSHYQETIDEWDINEVFADYGRGDTLPNLYKDNVFYRAMGPEYVAIAAQALKRVNPDATIWINEYGMENDTGARTQAILRTIEDWKRAGVPIDGVGLQSHIYNTRTDLIVDADGEAPELMSLIERLGRMGLTARISEMDAPEHANYGPSSQSKQFTGMLTACMQQPACTALSTWSTGPTDVYQDARHRLKPPGSDSLFRSDMTPTRAYYDMQALLKGRL